MAVISRVAPTGKNVNLVNTAVRKQISKGDVNLINLQQQQAVLQGQAQLLNTSISQTLGDVQKSIYSAQRAQRAQSAALGYVGQVAEVREQAQLQDQISNELSSIINQAEQGAISLASQETALNKAIVQTAAPTIAEELGEQLIKEKNSAVSRDIARQVFGGIGGAIGGAIQGGLTGLSFSKGLQTLIDPTSGFLKKAAAGAGLGFAVNNLMGQTFGAANAIHQAMGYDAWKTDPTITNLINQGLFGGGVLLGAAGRGFDRLIARGDKSGNATAYFQNRLIASGKYVPGGEGLEAATDLYEKGNTLQGKIAKFFGKDYQQDAFLSEAGADLKKELGIGLDGKKVGKAARELTASEKIVLGKRAAKVEGKLAAKAAGTPGKIKSTASKLTKGLKINPWVLGTSMVIGAVLGGIKGGATPKYKLDLEALRQQGQAQELEELGLDLSAVADYVYNK